jgi:CDP-diacylglycerol--glycerol-3-phosphate 3-phosphatidyltransferase
MIIMKIPTFLTLLRLMLIPVVVVFFYLPFRWAHFSAAAIFGLAGITDWLDGYFARKLNQTSKFGAFLDPVVDKIIVVIALILLVSNPQLPYLSLAVFIIVGREIIVSALREWMAELGKRASVAVCYTSKIKTTLQIIAIVLLLACNPQKIDLFMQVGYVFLYIAAFLTIWTMLMYLKVALPYFAKNN